MHPDVLITAVFGGSVALAALATVFALLRSRPDVRSTDEDGEERPVAPVH